MDVKALAKSKRAHTLHHSKKNQSHQSSKGSLVGSGDKKPSGNQAKVKPPQFRAHKPLPSNWDRYDDASNLPSDEAQTDSAQSSGVVLPKSKGADYAYLISEAKAQAETHQTSTAFPFSDDVTYGFRMDFGSMLVERGQNILSWIEDDGFEFEEKGRSDFQAPFLSLNLDFLAERLAKLKPSQRLFIEPGLIQERLDMLDSKLPARVEDEPNAPPVEENTSASFISANEKQIKNEDSTSERSDQMFMQASISQQTVSRGGLEVSNLEAELDMLLNSFSEQTIFESSSSFEAKHIAETVEQGSVMSNIDATGAAAVDKLLISDSGGVKVSGTVSKSKLMEDFDSWLDTI